MDAKTAVAKARLLDLTTGVLELVRDGNRDAEEVCRVFQIIKDETGFASRFFSPTPVALSITEAEARVVGVLGLGKVITLAQALSAWPGVEIDVSVTVPIRYSMETLQECARENQEKGTDWRLVYIHGFSLRQQRERLGTNRDHQPCFYDNNWWLQGKEDKWANFKPESGYYLVDFNGRFGLTSWKKQEKKIAELGDQFERAHETVIAEAVFSIFKITQERLLENWYHWGQALGSAGVRVPVGRFDRGGLIVVGCRPVWCGDDGLRVCLLRKFNT